MNSSFYKYGEWGYLEVDLSDGTTVRALGPPDRLYIPGSSTKLFSVSAALDDLGFDHRFETPVYAQGEVEDDTLSGDLVLVASGDLTMGGRTTNNGSVAFTSVDHTYANDVPGATLTPEDPLAGLDEIAEQVSEYGITRVDGDVIVDDRLFDPPPSGEPNPNLNPWPDPITINDNLIDVEITPGEVGEAPESVTWRPQVAPYHIDVQAKTVAAGDPNTVSVSPASDGRIVVSGNIASDAGTLLRVAPVEDPAAFARTALIEALERVGVSVSASPNGSNPASDLPEKGSYSADAKVAAYESPPFSEYAKLILKVSHNYGANLNVCLMAVEAGSTDCNDAFPVMKSFFQKAGVDTDQVALADGRGQPHGPVHPRGGDRSASLLAKAASGKGVSRDAARDGRRWQPRGQLQELPGKGQGLRQGRDGQPAGFRERAPGRQRVVGGVHGGKTRSLPRLLPGGQRREGEKHRGRPQDLQRRQQHRRHPPARRLEPRRGFTGRPI